MKTFLATDGYAALFIGAAVEGETFLIAGVVVRARRRQRRRKAAVKDL